MGQRGSRRTVRGLADDERFDYDSAWRTKLGASLSAEADRRDRERREAARREALRQESDRLAAKVRAELEREVRTAFSDTAMGDLWLRFTQPGFCASPWNYCTRRASPIDVCEPAQSGQGQAGALKPSRPYSFDPGDRSSCSRLQIVPIADKAKNPLGRLGSESYAARYATGERDVEEA